jgi:hypothetical protein
LRYESVEDERLSEATLDLDDGAAGFPIEAEARS